MSLRVVAILAIAAVSLAGCGAKAPAGTLKALDFQQPVGGSVMVVYQPFVNANPTGTVPTAGPMTQCAQNSVPNPPGQPSPVANCKGPYTTFSVHANLPTPTAGGYKLYAVGPKYELEALTLKATGPTSYVGTANDTTEDLEAKVTQMELRMDGVPVAVASGKAGNDTFAPAIAPAVTGTYTGHHLELTVTGLPANGTFMGELYPPNASTPTESFQIQAGKTTYDSKDHNIADFGQLHIHLGTSGVVVYKAAVTPNPK